ncbi:peptidyl-prolyl cis-trans isomerase [Rubritalea profundi]|uniref:PpiC domain-containing protein n=1 Tax=Rubritalea profundi TaxID=1658618 RepID=A0A2S7TZY1_9BACT|nr:peptidylprolyl isomerase [Rubritalea profundi]PQJ28299.1 hypothetical protein BSZ32_07105 [Rubritalea profundi]
MKFLKEPLLHFMLIGAGLFALYGWVNPEANQDGDREKIVITEGRIAQFISIYEKTWQHPPSQDELKSLIDDYVLEEIYYRQAVAMGIDQDDTIIRRRMRQKLEFLTDDVMLGTDANDEDLSKFLHAHPEKFSKDGLYSFEQIFINPQRHRDDLEGYLASVRAKLKAGEIVTSDSYFLPPKNMQTPAWKVDRDYGAGFAKKLDGLVLADWSEPLRSGLGVHFVRLSERTAGSLPALVDVRQRVEREWLHAKKVEKRSAFNEKFVEQYDIVIEWPEEDTDA